MRKDWQKISRRFSTVLPITVTTPRSSVSSKPRFTKRCYRLWTERKWSRSPRNFWISSEPDRNESYTKKTTTDCRRIESFRQELGRKNQSAPQTNSDSTDGTKMGFLLQQRTRHIQLGTVWSTLSVSGI